jgi:prevent-host-death family protein
LPDKEPIIQVSVTEAKGKLTDLVRRAEAGAEVLLTRHGHPAVRLVAVETKVVTETLDELRAKRRLALETLMKSAHKATPGPCAARSADFLYDEFGLPA